MPGLFCAIYSRLESSGPILRTVQNAKDQDTLLFDSVPQDESRPANRELPYVRRLTLSAEFRKLLQQTYKGFNLLVQTVGGRVAKLFHILDVS